MRKHTILLLLIVNITISYGQYVVKSQNILTPDINIENVKANVQFWIDHAYDPVNGGFFSNISRNGTVLNSVQANIASKSYYSKSLISQTRQAYGFARAFMLTGDENFLNYSKSALDFLLNHGWDNTNDGWYTFAKSDGTIDNDRWWNPNTGKWGFTQHYALLGIVANYEATHNPVIKSWIDKGEASINNHMWDSRSGYEGYYEQANSNWTGLSGKGFTCTVDAITTHAELTYLLTQDNAHKSRLTQLGDIIVKRFVPTMDDSKVKVLYPEGYNNNWGVSSYTTDGSVGHFIKTAWVLGRAYLCDTTKKEFQIAAAKILDKSWTYQNGNVSIWDHTNGGPFNSINIGTGNWGANGDNKDYWTLEQGFTGPMINYYITKNPIYLQMADESLSFYMNHFIDKTYGETYQELDPTGTVARVDTKGDDFKANYHTIELWYYAYLYSNLYYLHQPASLFYKFVPSTSSQNITLTPIPMEDGLLRIKSVTLDGTDFTSFDSRSRTLNIPANKGGIFKVTFESLQRPTGLNPVSTSKISIYPNPATNIINIDGIANSQEIQLVDITGKVVIRAASNSQSSIQVDLQNLKSGIYFVRIFYKSGSCEIEKVVKL